MIIKLSNYFDIDKTITCGQIFRYDIEDDNSYTVLLPDRVINIKKINDELIVNSSNNDHLEEVVKEYFDLNRDYDSINKELLKRDKSLEKIIDSSYGLKVMNEPKLEALISYMLSTNNSVPNIKKALDNISKMFGKKVVFNNKEYYLFPELESLVKATPKDFREAKFGFRDEYTCDIVHKIYNKEFDLDLIDNLNSKDAMDYLMTQKGIGIKVASCILLFSYKRQDVFPVDTWVKKFMKEEYNIEGIDNINNFIYDKYGEYSGLVIQYIFNYNRNMVIK